MEISTGASARRPERWSSRDDRLVLAACCSKQAGRSLELQDLPPPSPEKASMAANTCQTARLKGEGWKRAGHENIFSSVPPSLR